MKQFKHTAGLLLVMLGLLGQSVFATAAAPQNLDILQLPEWGVTSSSYGGKLLLSDSPEMVYEDGIMYQDEVAGDVRLFFHHVNATTTAKRIVVMLENDGSETANVTVYQYGLGGPGADWMAVGKAAQKAYMAGSEIYLVAVPGKGWAPLSTRLTDTVVQPNMLVNGIYDFTTDRPVKVKVMMLPVNAIEDKFAQQAKQLSADEQHLRGTFDGRDRLMIPNKVYNPGEDGAVAVTLADNKIDAYLEGIDATDGSKVVNYGNYGVVYKIFLPSDNSGKIKYYLNPRGGDYAGVMGVKYLHVNEAPVPTPDSNAGFGSNKLTDFAPIGTYKSGESLWLTFSPPGASNLPVKLVILPQ
jgi:hypothetical protein